MVALDPRPAVRLALLRAGRHLGPRSLANLRSVLSYLELGNWLETLPAGRPAPLATDTAVFEEALRRVTGRRPLYLEFGVFEGRSMRWWVSNLRNPDARFVGFDSFEGLPEGWRPGTPQGHFATAGPPSIDDPRVSFVAGWFDQTLPGFAIPEHDQLIVNVDSDLYASADIVLRCLEPHLRSGTLLYFDELPDRDHEMRALLESLERSGKSVSPIAIGKGGVHWLFEYPPPASSPASLDPSH